MIEKKYPYLSSPIKIGPLTLRNRMASAPTSLATLAPGGHLSMENVAYYELKAKGGAGIVTLGDVIVHPTGLAHPEAVLLTDPDIYPSLYTVAEAIKRHGAVASIEIDHGGGGCLPIFTSDGKAHGPSDMINPRSGAHVEGMSKVMIEEMIEAYGNGAAVAVTAGFQMITIHGGHGWLMSQFLSPFANKRTDEYGGTLENRMRFMHQVIDNVREKCGSGIAIEIRLSGSELFENGYSVEEGVQIAKSIDGKVDLLHISAGTFLNPKTETIMHPSMFLPHGCNVYLAEAVKKEVKTPVATVGSLTDPDKMEEIISTGKADIVCIARGLLADPFLPKKIDLGEAEDIRPCLRCFECQGGMFLTRTTRCSVNPVIGNERDVKLPIVPALEKKKVVVVGGGPAGMEAALIAAVRGHGVMLYEKSDSLGGVLKYGKDVPFKSNMYKYVQYMERQVRNAGVTLKLRTTLTPESAEKLNADVLISAIGAVPILPQIPGLVNDNYILGADAHHRMDEIGQNVVIIGGGLVGCELGIHLGMTGRTPLVLEMRDVVAKDCNLQHKKALDLELEKYVQVHTGVTCTGRTSEGVTVVNAEGEKFSFIADTVVIAAGYHAPSDDVESFRYCAPEFHSIGDCLKPGKILDAVRSGFFTAMDL